MENNIKKILRRLLNEAYVDQHGNLKDFSVDQDDLEQAVWSDEDFKKDLYQQMEYANPTLPNIFKDLSDSKRRIYVDLLLDPFDNQLSRMENGEVVNYAFNYNQTQFKKSVVNYMTDWVSFGDHHFPISPEVLSKLDERTQTQILNIFYKELNYPIFMDEEQYNLFTSKNQNLINTKLKKLVRVY